MSLELTLSQADLEKLVAKQCTSELWQEYEKNGENQAKKVISKLKNNISGKFGVSKVISNTKIIKLLKSEYGIRATPLIRAIRKASGRAMSGVSVVAIMTAPAWCPGQCTYCPTSAIAAKSYTGFEPAARRARFNGFDPYRQVQSRLTQFKDNGHYPSKCELIVMGGTFNSLPINYQQSFLKGAYDAFNGEVSESLETSILKNETAESRVIGLVIETRPDWARDYQVKQLLDWGTTRIELGIQSLDDFVLEKTKRGHDVAESIRATKTCKDAFLKVGYHIMLGAYSTVEKEKEELPQIFSNSDFRPDMLKIYPLLIIPGTPMHEEWANGNFIPYTTEEVVEVICEIKKNCPSYVRIMRIDRDIPSPQIAAGVKETNLREIVAASMIEKNYKCKCIRCREAGIYSWKNKKTLDVNDLKLNRIDYSASKGLESFITYDFESEDLLAGFLRLRKQNDAPCAHNSIDNATAGIRELRVFGEQVEIGKTLNGAIQHMHLGKKLIETAIEIAKNEWGAEKLAVTAGVGVRQYYQNLGFEKVGPYVIKKL